VSQPIRVTRFGFCWPRWHCRWSWLFRPASRLDPFLWAGALAVLGKDWLAARGFRLTPGPRGWRYLAVWLAGVTCLIGLGAVLMNDAGRNLAVGDRNRVSAIIVLAAVLLMPIARLAWTPSFLGHNRHRPQREAATTHTGEFNGVYFTS
jgi:hypothetical protein